MRFLYGSLILFFTGIFIPAQTDAQQFGASLAAGFNASQIDGDLLAGFDKVGLTGGIKVNTTLKKRIDLNVEFLYSERGSRPDVFNPEYDPDIHIALKYIELPVYISINDWWQEEDKYFKVAAYGGVSFARLLSARTTDYFNEPDQSYDLLAPLFNENDLSWLLGLSLRLNRHWGLTARYTRGITPLFNPVKHDLTGRRLLTYFVTFRLEYYIR